MQFMQLGLGTTGFSSTPNLGHGREITGVMAVTALLQSVCSML